MESDNELVTEGERTDAVRQDRLWFLESRDQISRAMQGTEGLGQLSHVLETVLPIFGCDRVWLAYPCDTESRTWRMAAQHACPEFAECTSLDLDLSMDAEIAEAIRLVTVSEDAVRFGAAASNSLPGVLARRFGVQSQMCIAVHPKIGKPYTFGLDQCAGPRTWTRQEEELFEAAGERLATLLTSLSLSRDLLENKARLEEAQRVAHVGHWDWNLETGEIIWSDETYRIFGFKPQERPMEIATVSGLVHPDDREALYREVDVEVAAGVHPVHEHRIVRPSGEVRTVQSITSKLWKTTDVGPEDGISREHNRLFGTVQDITELKQAEEASHALSRDLQESKDWLEEAQRVAHLGYWVWDLETNQVIWSDETYRIFGLVPKAGSFDVSVVGEMIHPDDREAVFRIADEAIRSGTRADCEHRLIRPDGEMRVVHSLGDVRKNSQGRIQMFGTTQDITDRKRGDEDREALSNALQQSNARLEQAQRLAHIGHYEWDLIENRVTYSEELCRIWGMPPVKDTFDVRAIFERIHPEDREKVSREAAEVISNGIHAQSEHRIVLTSGEVRVILGLGTIKRDESGKAYEMFGTGQDITERKLAEQALRQSQFYLSEGERLAH